MEVRRTNSSKARRLQRPARYFTIEHANRTLPLVRRIVSEVVREYAVVCNLEDQVQRAAAEGRTERVLRLRDEHTDRLDHLRELTDELATIGVELKDGEKGLIDFPSQRDDRDIYLCWRLGEKRIEHWHELDAGFIGRRRLNSADVA